MDQPLVEALQAWQTPMFVTQWPGHQNFSDAILSHVVESTRNQAESIDSAVAIDAKQRLQESELNFLEGELNEICALREFLEDAVMMVAQEVNYGYWPETAEGKANIVESWYHVTQMGGYHDVHSHPNCSWCGIYCLQAGESGLTERSGVNRFYDPRINAEHYQDAGTAYLAGEGIWDFVPQDGQVIIFPSYLKHSALPYFGEQDRIVVAFNAQVHFV